MHPHGVWRCEGDDDWISVVARTDAEWRALCNLVPGLSGMAALDLDQRIAAERAIDAALTAWAGSRSAPAAAEALLKAGIPAAALARYGDLVKSPHLAARGFWDRHGAGVLPGLPWRASFGRTTAPRRNWARIAITCSPTSLGCRRNVLPSCGRAERSARASSPAKLGRCRRHTATEGS